jgi:hypothetical protein
VITHTAPSVVLRHSGADKPVFTPSELAAQTAVFRAGLGGDDPHLLHHRRVMATTHRG